MKTTTFIALTLLGQLCLFAGSEQIIKQRAKDLRDQNNARQGVPPPATQRPPSAAQPQTPAAAAPVVISVTPQQQAMLRLQTALALFRPGNKATPEQKQQLAGALTGLAVGAAKPAALALNSLSDSLAAALSEKLLADATRKRLSMNLAAVMNPANLSSSQLSETVLDVKALLEANNGNKALAESVARHLNLIAGQTAPAVSAK